MSTDHTNQAGFDSPETFTVSDTKGGALSRLLSPTLILPLVAGFLLWVLLTAVLNVMGLPAPRLLALLVALVLMGGIVAL